MIRPCNRCAKYPASLWIEDSDRKYCIGVCHFVSDLIGRENICRVYEMYQEGLVMSLEHLFSFIAKDIYSLYSDKTLNQVLCILSTIFSILDLPIYILPDINSYTQIQQVIHSIPTDCMQLHIKVSLFLIDVHNYYLQHFKLSKYSIVSSNDIKNRISTVSFSHPDHDITSFYQANVHKSTINSIQPIIENILQPHIKEINGIVLTSNERYLISCSLEKQLSIWDIDSNKQLTTLSGHTHQIHSIHLSHDDIHLASVSLDKTLKIWNRTSFRQCLSFKSHTRAVTSVLWSNDNKYCISGSKDATLKLWDLHYLRLKHTFLGHKSSITCLQLTRNNKILISGSRDKSIMLWSLTSFSSMCSLSGHTQDITQIQLTFNDEILYSSSYDNTIRVWDMRSYRCRSVIYLDFLT